MSDQNRWPSRGGCRGCSAGNRNRNRVDELAAPELDTHKSENSISTIDVSRSIKLDEAAHRTWLEQAARPQGTNGKRFVDAVAELVAQPAAERRTKACLA